MNVNFVLLKKLSIAILCAAALFQLITLFMMLLSRPITNTLSFSSIANAQYNEPLAQQKSLEPSSGTFDYKVIGYRASDTRASVIVERNNQTFVVQQGDLLENAYTLISVDSNFAIFSLNGKNYQLSTNLPIGN
ncbi:hypothetical protein N9I84_05395 [Gammaproteobacteria bacterium]|nr:hypothetical protein [Gammaproteobacteria bacterium]|tara:strand:- start:6881 stop:7282 length:402 start_codon:yes stop_codon:yes gene_type:complete